MAKRPPTDPAIRKMTTEELEERADVLRKLNPTDEENEKRRFAYQAEIYRRRKPSGKA